MPLERDEALRILQRTLDMTRGDQAEVLLISGTTALTRYANSSIHQNVASRDAVVRVRVVRGKQIGVADGNALDSESIREVVLRAEGIAKVQKPNREFKSLPTAGAPSRVDNYNKSTADSTPEERAAAVAAAVKIARDAGVKLFGAVSASTHLFAVANTLGVEAYDEMSTGAMTVAAIADRDGKKGYGWAEEAQVDITRIDPIALAKVATEKALQSLGAKPLEAGEYEVVLEPVAVADLVSTLGSTTFGAMEYQEGRSYICNRLGHKIVDPMVNLFDDGLDRHGLPIAFDFEGVPKQRVDLIQEGRASGLVYDSYTAGREAGRSSTGHALPAPNPYGPVPMNLHLAPGDATSEELLEETKKGVYVTRFHYTNTIDPSKTLWTGMTRDGTFLIEDGEIREPVRNLRFTDGIVDALASGGLVGRDRRVVGFTDWTQVGACTVPPLKLNRYRFTGVTEF